MIKSIITLAAAVAISAASPAKADVTFSTQHLRDACAPAMTSECVVYVQGVIDMMRIDYFPLAGNSWRICLPDEMKAAQLIPLVLMDLEQRPGWLPMSAALAVFETTHRYFPCEKQK